MDLIEKRLKDPIDEKEKALMRKTPAAKVPTRGSVWLQLGFRDAEEHYLKAELVLRLDRSIASLGLTQRVAARRIATTQLELSKILGGKFSEVSLEEKLMRFLTALGYHDRAHDRRPTGEKTSGFGAPPFCGAVACPRRLDPLTSGLSFARQVAGKAPALAKPATPLHAGMAALSSGASRDLPARRLGLQRNATGTDTP
jgi:predicted XRE-type DNA-binding protein